MIYMLHCQRLGFELLIVFFLLLSTQIVVAKDDNVSADVSTLPPSIELEATKLEVKPTAADIELESLIEGIFSNIETLTNIDVEVKSGVVNLTGTVANEGHSLRAKSIVDELSGVIAVESAVETTLDVQSNVTPLLSNLKSDVRRLIRSLPVFGIALLVFLVIFFTGHFVSKLTDFWSRFAHNPFIGELLAHAVKIASLVIALIVALNIVGASSLITTLLGGAGVIGLAIGFAIKDTLENYISSIMLSIRQPFRSKDRVKIGDEEGIVVRLTSRATVLMTPEGNHLRIPNSTVFKANIVNFSTNPERRFEFGITISSESDVLEAMSAALNALRTLDFVLKEPIASATIDTVTDRDASLSFTGWIDQSKSDFGRCRSVALLAVQDAVNQLDKPQSSVRQEKLDSQNLKVVQDDSGDIVANNETEKFPWSKERQKLASSVLDIKADTHLEQRADDDREDLAHTDLLDEQRPVE